MKKIKRSFFNKRKAFTLIEVMIALSIMMVVVLALMSSYYSYYSSVKQAMYKNIGQNLTELLLEDTRNLSVTVLDYLVKGGQFPAPEAWERYKCSSTFPGCYEVASLEEEIDNSIINGIPYPKDTNASISIYDSGIIDATYRLERIESVFGVTNSPTLSQSLLKNLPNNIIITPVHYVLTDSNGATSDYFNYTILFNKYTFPYYMRRIIITDLTPNIDQTAQKIYEVNVTIYWGGTLNEENGQYIGGKSITLKGEKSFSQ